MSVKTTKDFFKPTNLISLLKKISGSTLIVVSSVVILRTFILDWSVVPSGSMSNTFLIGDVVMYWKCAYGNFGLHSIPIIGHYFIDRRLSNTFIKKCNIRRGDIVVFAKHGAYLTKRVIGLPARKVNGKQVEGDLVEWNGLDLRINGKSTIFKPDGSTIGAPPKEYLLSKQHSDSDRDIVMIQYEAFIPLDDGKHMKIKVLIEKKPPKYRWCRYRVPPGHVFVVGDNRPRRHSFDCREFLFGGDVPIASVNGRVFMRLFGSNSKVFKRERGLVKSILSFPLLITKYIAGLNLLRFGMIDKVRVKLEEFDYPKIPEEEYNIIPVKNEK
jgi:signal peptidase I